MYELFGKRDKFSLFIVQMGLLSSNISSTISSGSISSELPQIARCSLRTDDVIPRDSDLFSKMIAQGGNRAALPKQLKNTFHCYPHVFKNLV